MSKSTKIWLWIATGLIVVGLMIGIGVLSMTRGYLTNLATEVYQSNTYEISESYQHISIRTNTADVKFALAEDGKCKVVCYDTEKLRHAVSVQDNTLTVQLNDTRKWYDYLSINWITPTVTVYLPQVAYGALTVQYDTGDVFIPKDFLFETIDISGHTGFVHNLASATGYIKIHTTTGRIMVDDISAQSLDLFTTTGDVSLKHTEAGDVKIDISTGMVRIVETQCKNLTATGNTGHLLMENVQASGKFVLERDTGDVTLTDCDAAEIYIETDTGNVEGSLLSPKVFDAKTDTGSVRVPSTNTGGICKITTDTGNIYIYLTV